MPQLSMSIVIDDTGQISIKVEPPMALGNKMVMYGLLEVAKDNLQAYWAESERKVQPASMDDVNKLRLVGGGN